MRQIVFEKFKSAQKHCLYMHNKDLQRWFIVCSKTEELNNFKLSNGFLNAFKQRFGISERKNNEIGIKE